jgi:hypothetical protein
VLTAPSEFMEQSLFGNAISLDHDRMRTLAVGCPGCNATHAQGGSIYLYEPTSPSAKKWTHTSTLTTSTNVYRAGKNFVSIHKNTVVADVSSNADATLADNLIFDNAVVFSKDREEWSQQQVLRAGNTMLSDDITALDVFDETIVLGSKDSAKITFAGQTTTGQVQILYPSTERFGLKSKGKPQPVQWSVQQVLVTPDTAPAAAVDETFGSSVSIDGNRLVVGASKGLNSYIYERKEVSGKWSVQQKIVHASNVVDMSTIGASILAATGANVEVWDETQKWDCLLVSLEDHFNDGWDIAELVVDVPGGEKDSFTSRCDTPNPFQFRYCPNALNDEGLYRFSIKNGKEAKFHWEQLWRVYDEATGEWYTGNWDTKMDFEWDATNHRFNAKKIEHELPNNITCKACKTKPTEKPSSRLRQLHSKDHTVHPTISPAPTVQTSLGVSGPWQELKLTSTTVTNDWFDSQHKGTSYYISTKDGKRLLSTGTMCPWQANAAGATCWEDYPDGEYILRVGGALDRTTDHLYTFCGAINTQTQESQMVFRVSNGECTIVSHIKSKNFCARSVHITQAAMVEISILGVSGALGSAEYSQLTTAIASSVPGGSASGVTILSAVSTGSGITVTAEVQVDAKTAGIDYSDIDTLDAFEVAATTELSTNKILASLMSGEVNTNLHSATHVELVGFKLSGNGEVLDGPVLVNEVVDFADALNGDATSESPAQSEAGAIIKVMAVAGFVLAAVGVAVGAAFIVTARPAPTSSTAPAEVVTAEVAEEEEVVSVVAPVKSSKKKKVSPKNELTLNDMTELVKQEEAALELMLKNSL